MRIVTYRKCQECGSTYDAALKDCPKCGKENDDPASTRGFSGFYPVGAAREIALALGGYLLLSLVATAVQLIQLSAGGQSAVTDPVNLSIAQYVSYGTVLVLLCLIVFDKWKGILRKFSWKGPVLGLVGFIVIYVFNFLYGLVLSLAGANVTDNQNQTLVNQIVLASPALAIVFLGLLGPFAEELIYRVGLFGVLKRANDWIAYIVAGAIFGFIHFDFTNIGSLNEWLNLPSYIVPGLILCYVYDKQGLGASLTTHALNNLLSVILIAAGAV